VLGESLTPQIAFGLLVIIAGVVLINLPVRAAALQKAPKAPKAP
jgi:drug/metabolite transporter (DMT)-like permease